MRAIVNKATVGVISDFQVAGCMKGRYINLENMPLPVMTLMASSIDRVMLRYRVKVGKKFFGKYHKER